MLLRIAAIVGILVLSVAEAQVYRSTDEDGNPVYSDTPGTNAQELKLPPVNIIPSGPTELNFEVKQPEFDLEKYRTLEIVAPQNDASVFINTANLPIEVKLLPPVKRALGHSLVVLWDGKVLFENQNSYLLGDADRGTHVLEARVVDEKGKILIRSQPVNVHIRKPTVLNRP
ncbi:MAG TPA: DUF4124 domain-containing protein [Gammaproteobacteria bacterium]|jgi:hypothetical protein